MEAAVYLLRTVRKIIVVDRSAIKRTDRGAISDNETVNSRTVLLHCRDVSHDAGQLPKSKDILRRRFDPQLQYCFGTHGLASLRLRTQHSIAR